MKTCSSGELGCFFEVPICSFFEFQEGTDSPFPKVLRVVRFLASYLQVNKALALFCAVLLPFWGVEASRRRCETEIKAQKHEL